VSSASPILCVFCSMPVPKVALEVHHRHAARFAGGGEIVVDALLTARMKQLPSPRMRAGIPVRALLVGTAGE
jgi:hypothetical protein